MNERNCLKEFLRYCTLNVLGMIGLSCYILADTFFVSKGLGEKGLAALNLAIPVYGFIHGIGLMFGMGGATRFSIYRGQGNEEEGNRLFTHMLLTASVPAVIGVICGLFFSNQITRALGANEEIFSMTRTYLRVMLLFTPAYLLNEMLLCFVRNDGKPRRSMMAMLSGSIANIILDYVFIFPMNMGMFGAILATGLAPVISILVMSPHWFKKENTFHFVRSKFHGKMAASILFLGFPTLVTEFSSGIVILVFNGILLKLSGNTAVAAYGVIANLSLVVASMYTGTAQGMQPLVSRYYGAGNKDGIRRILRYGLITEAVISVVVYSGVLLFAGPITSVFNSEHSIQLQQIAEAGLKLYFPASIFLGFNIVIATFFTSTEWALPAQIISLLRGLFVIIPMAFLLSSLFGITGVWLSFPVTEALVSLVGMAILYLGKHHLKG